MAGVQTEVQELADGKVRLTVEVPSPDLRHAVEHAASELADSVRIPGFRKGKVPLPVLLSRLGRERVYAEAVESHIGGWFWNAAARSRLQPIERPDYAYDLPASDGGGFRFTATFAVQAKPEVADWTALEVPYAEPEVPAEVVDAEVEHLRGTVAELVPVEGRAAREGDTLVVDLVAGDEAQRDYVVELGSGRLVEEIEEALAGVAAGETKEIAFESADGEPRTVVATVKEIKEKVLPPLDDELARSASEFDTLAELRADIEGKLRGQLAEELEAEFRATVADRLVEASKVEAAGPLVESRAAELWHGLTHSLERRGVDPETYLKVTGQTAEELEERLRTEARRSVSRELVLEAAADRLGLEIGDDEIRGLIRNEAEAAGEDPEAAVERVWASGRHESLRGDLRLRAALDRVAAEVKRIPVELARAREKLWTPGKEKAPGDPKLWTPGSKEPA